MEPKFCKDCKHFKDAGAFAYFGSGFTWPQTCNQPPERELIHGRKTPTDPKRMRSEQGACKPEGLLWEEKPEPPPAATQIPPLPGTPEAIGPVNYAPPIHQPHAWWKFWTAPHKDRYL